jgi:hypothetical protein
VNVVLEDEQREGLEELVLSAIPPARLLSEARVGLEVVEAKETGPSRRGIRQEAPLVPLARATSVI